MSTADLRDAFNSAAVSKGIRCDKVLLMYCDEYGHHGESKRDHQLVVFHCTDGREFTTIVKPGASVNVAAVLCGQKAVEDGQNN